MNTYQNLLGSKDGGWVTGDGTPQEDPRLGHCEPRGSDRYAVARWQSRARDDWKQARALMRKARAIRDGHREGPHFGTIVSIALGFRKSAHRCMQEAQAADDRADTGHAHQHDAA